MNYYWQEALFVNREEDMGLEGLRHAKMSYYPLYQVTKYKGVLKDESGDDQTSH